MKAKTIVALLAIAVLAGVYTWREMRRPETTSAMRGQQLAIDLGCFACHGPEGQGGVADPTAPGGEVPDWRHATAVLFVESREEIAEWIRTGTTAREQARKPRAVAPLVPMPGYEEYLSADEVEDLVNYFVAVSGWREEYSEDAWQGRKHAEGLGCFGCHGPSGMGGVKNPGSFKGHIPPWDGEEFAELVRDEAELREWILEGRIERLWSNPAARVFLEGQETPMPAYHDFLSDAELDEIIAYIKLLREELEVTDEGEEAAEVIGTIVVPTGWGRGR